MSDVPPDDFAFRQWLASRLMPYEATQPSHPLYAPLQEGTPHDPVLRILRDIRLNASGQSLNLVSGFSGSGKSSELRRLRQNLDDQHFQSFILDADEYFMPTECVDIEVLLIKLAAAWCEALDARSSLRPDSQGYLPRFWHWLKTTEVSIEGVDAGKDVKAKVILKDNPSLISQINDARKKRPGVIRTELRKFFHQITTALRADKSICTSPVLILDTLEKLADTPATNGAVYDSFRKLLTAHFDELCIPDLHIILTMPPWIKFAGLGQDRVRMIYGVKLWQHDTARTPWPDGYARMRAVALKRFTEEGLQRFFGPADKDGTRPLVDMLIHASAGHVRDFIHLLYELLLNAPDGPPPAGQPIIGESHVRQIISEHQGNIARVSSEAAKCLHEISLTRLCSYPDQSSAAALTLTSLFNSHLAFPLPNSPEWCDIHPLCMDAVKKIMDRQNPPPAPAAPAAASAARPARKKAAAARKAAPRAKKKP